jgi:hypothetical protein
MPRVMPTTDPTKGMASSVHHLRRVKNGANMDTIAERAYLKEPSAEAIRLVVAQGDMNALSTVVSIWHLALPIPAHCR